jgi:nucleoside-diphosphate-sugar epimerase
MNISTTLKSGPQCCLIAGVTGLEGRSLLSYLVSRPTSEIPLILGLSRQSPTDLNAHASDRVKFAQLDLFKDETITAFKQNHKDVLNRITIVYFVVNNETGDETKNVQVNGKLFQVFLDLVVECCPQLQQVNLQTGVKYYGSHVMPFKTPARETDPRFSGPNYYFVQEDYLIEKCKSCNGKFTYCILRPSEIIGFSLDKYMMMGCSIAFYAYLCKVMNKKFIFPGSVEYWNALVECTDSNLLARAHLYTSLTNECGNKAFNVNNGDLFRWKYMWPIIAGYFGIDWEGPQQDPKNPNIHLTWGRILEDLKPDNVWKDVAAKEGLKENNFSALLSPVFMDELFSRKWDVVLNASLIRLLGFKEYIPTEESFFRLFDQLKEHKYLPQDLPSMGLRYTTNIEEIQQILCRIKDIEISVGKLCGVGEGVRTGLGVRVEGIEREE